MDINDFEQELEQEEVPVELPIFDKAGDQYEGFDGRGATISVVGSDSQRVRSAQRATTRRTLRSSRTQLSPEQLESNRVHEAAAAVVAWHGWTSDGQRLECTPANVRALLTAAPHILRQVEEGVKSHADFFTSSSNSS